MLLPRTHKREWEAYLRLVDDGSLDCRGRVCWSVRPCFAIHRLQFDGTRTSRML